MTKIERYKNLYADQEQAHCDENQSQNIESHADLRYEKATVKQESVHIKK